MLRRHGVRFRTALMLFDAAVAAVLLVGLSVLRFGSDWSVYWRYITPEPIALPVILGAGWVAILASFGLYRPRARLSIRSEAVDIAKATAVLAAIALSLFFVFRLPDVSRLFLLGFFPALAAATLLAASLLVGAVAILWLPLLWVAIGLALAAVHGSVPSGSPAGDDRRVAPAVGPAVG